IDRHRLTACIIGHGPEIGHYPVFPKKRVVCGRSRRGIADNLTGNVDPDCLRKTLPQGTEILQPFFFVPKERMSRLIACQVRNANDLAAIVHPLWKTEGPSESADVDHCSAVPKERIQGWDASRGVGCKAGKEL